MPLLNACPFCGCADDEEKAPFPTHAFRSMRIECSCGAGGPDAATSVQAAVLWNERPLEDKLVERIAAFVETYGGYPQSPYGRRKKIADDVRRRAFDQEAVDAVAG